MRAARAAGAARSAALPAVSDSPRAWRGRRSQPPASVYAFNKAISSLPPSLPTAGRVGPSPPKEPRRSSLPAGGTGRERPACDPCPGCALGVIILLLFLLTLRCALRLGHSCKVAGKGCAPSRIAPRRGSIGGSASAPQPSRTGFPGRGAEGASSGASTAQTLQRCFLSRCPRH